jgi:predicted metal-dependent enzyme (double-stranded beta helix superfamily)
VTTLPREDVPALTPTLLAETVRRYASQPARWRPYVRFGSAERYYTRLELTEAHEVWLLTWLPGQGTEIHDHGGASGAFAVVQGELTERAFSTRPVSPSPWELPAGAIRAFGPRHVHEVRNRGTEPAVSVHAYSPALATMTYYRELPGAGGIAPDRTNDVTD